MSEQGKESQSWQHDQQISFKNISSHLQLLKEALEKTLSEEKKKLDQLVNTRNNLKNP